MGIQVAQSEIEAVTVYTSGAIVVRAAELTSLDGAWPEEVRVAGLPLTLDDASIRVRVEGSATVPGAVGFRVALEVLGDNASAPPDEQALREARRDVLILEARQKDLDRITNRLAKIAPNSRPPGKEGEPPPPSPHTGRLSLMAFQQEKLRALASVAQDLQEKLRTARERLADLEDRKQRASNARPARPNELRKTLLVSLRSSGAGTPGSARLVFEYQVPGARWAPAYTLHFDADWSHASLAMRAVVAQRTGEDWRGVRVSLSTAQMHAWTELPELTSLRLGRWQPPAKTGWRSPPTGVEELYVDYDRETAGRKTEPVEMLLAAGPSPPSPVPQPPPKPAPAPGEFTKTFARPAMAMPAQARFREETTPRFVGAAALPPAPSQAPPPSGPSTESFAAAASILHQPDGVQTYAAPSSLDYAALYMPGADDPRRGKLAPARPSTRLEIFTQTQVSIQVNTIAVVQQACTEAAQLGVLPAAHSFPASVDGFDFAYRAQLPVDIPSDGQFHTIPLRTGEAESRLYYVTVPRAAPSVFRFTDIVNPLDAPLLRGPADIYSAGAFLMTAPLRLTPSKGVIKLGLGVEQRIKVSRNTAYAEETTGMMSGSLNLKHDIHIELRNLLRTAVQVEVRERVPVARSGDDQVRVTVSAKPQWELYQPTEGSLLGGHVWKVQVQPAEVLQLHAAYTITLPAKLEIASGNRREN
jgi:hypothetical protein